MSPGSVTFLDGTNPLGAAALLANGTASMKTRLGAGVHTITARFMATVLFAKSTSSAQMVTVELPGTLFPSSTSLLATVPGGAGAYFLTGTVESSWPVAPTGVVSFLSGTSLGSAALGQASRAFAAVTPTPSRYSLTPQENELAADFNADGIPDLAILGTDAASSTNVVRILPGKGDGTFLPEIDTGTGLSYTQGMATGDLNGDGLPDLAVTAGYFGDTVVILLGKGDGTFQAPVAYEVQGNPFQIVAADFDRDGIQDLAIAINYQFQTFNGSVAILHGRGDGSFDPPTTYYPAGGPTPQMQGLVAADFNGDGAPDLALAVEPGSSCGCTINILAGNGDGTLQSAVIYPVADGYVTTVVTGDFNGDGVPDLATANSQQVIVLLGSATGIFLQPTAYSLGPGILTNDLAAADFNGDGILDLLVGGGDGNVAGSLMVLTGNAGGGFASPLLFPVAIPLESVLVAADFNGDGAPDLAFTASSIGDRSESRGEVLLNSATATASLSGVNVTGAGLHQLTASYGGDARHSMSNSPPVAVVGVPPSPMATLALSMPRASVGVAIRLTATVVLNGAPVFPGLVTFGDAKQVLGSAQLEANGTASITVRPAVGSYQLTASFTPTMVLGAVVSGPQALIVGGKLAATTTISASGAAGRYILSSTVAGSGTSAPTGTVSFVDQQTHNVLAKVALGTPVATQTFLPQAVFSTGLAPVSIAVGDFNSDGAPDIAVANKASNTVSVRLGKGNGLFGVESIYHTGAGLDSIVTGDFNSDGIIDLAAANSIDGDVRVLLGKADGSFSVQLAKYIIRPFATGGLPIQLTVADLNGDGLPDFGLASGGPAYQLFGNGNGTFQPAIASATSPTSIVAAAADFSGTGVQDLVLVDASLTRGILFSSIHSPAGSFRVRGGVTFIAAGDFNGDGVPDIAVAVGNAVTVQLITRTVVNNQPQLSLGSQASYDVGANPVWVTSGDFNHDGIPDLAVANSGDQTMSVLFGNGDGTFQDQVVLPVGNSPSAAGAGDFNRDGVVDLVVTNQADNTVSLLLSRVTQTVSVSSGTVTISGTGIHPVVAVYSGDANHPASSTAAILLAGG